MRAWLQENYGMSLLISLVAGLVILFGIANALAATNPTPTSATTSAPSVQADTGQGRTEPIEIVQRLRNLLPPGLSATNAPQQPQAELPAQPTVSLFTVKIIDDATNAPLSGTLTAGDQVVTADAKGLAIFKNLTLGTKVKVDVPSYSPAEITYDGQPQAEVRLKLNALIGKIIDEATGNPLAGVLVSDGKSFTTTAEDGSFSLENLAKDTLLRVRHHGYDRALIDLAQQRPTEVKLRPRNIRALYLTFYGVGDEDLLNHALQVIRETEANALVIDVKGDRGWVAYKSNVPLVAEIGAQTEIQIQDPKKFIDDLHAEGIYVIARIVAFKDNNLAQAHPELGVLNAHTGELWVDGEGLVWLDPFKEANWDYNIALATEAASYGFDEIQFDYIRFPTDPAAGTDLASAVFAGENTMENRVAAINGFLQKADAALKPYGVALAMDCFGYVTWRTDDMGIGQHLESLARHVDYICPMVYPTLYWDGIPRTDGGDPYEQTAPAHPYEIVNLSLATAAARIQGARAQLRPWLQYYNDYILDIDYGAHEINLQKQATYDANLDSWMMWDPSNRYVKGGFEPKQ